MGKQKTVNNTGASMDYAKQWKVIELKRARDAVRRLHNTPSIKGVLALVQKVGELIRKLS